MPAAAWKTPAILCVAPNGAKRTKSDHPALPMTPAELAETARACLRAGAAMMHMHVRDAAGVHTLDAGLYAEATRAVREQVGEDMLIQITTEAVGRFGPDEQMAVVRAVRPEAVSLAPGELFPDEAGEARAAAFLDELAQERTLVQYVLYSPEDVRRLRRLKDEGVAPARGGSALFVLGRHTPGQRSRPNDLLPFLAAWEGERWNWMVCAFGPLEGGCALTAMALEGHARIGFENNLDLADGAMAPDNAALVAQAARGAALLGRPVASADQARRILNGLG